MFRFVDRGALLESIEAVAEPHEFESRLTLSHDGRQEDEVVDFEANDLVGAPTSILMHPSHDLLDALVHVLTRGAIPALVPGRLMLVEILQWVWLDPLVSRVGVMLIVRWSIGRTGDTGSILLDLTAKGPLARISGNPRRLIRTQLDATGRSEKRRSCHLWLTDVGVSIAHTTTKLLSACLHRI